jgi:hypothetical protein
VLGAHDVEVAEQDVVLDSAGPVGLRVLAVLPLGEESDEFANLINTLLELIAAVITIVDVNGAEAEAEPRIFGARLRRGRIP